MERDFDLVVIGTGTAAEAAAGPCREAGWSVAIADELPFGGTCVLRGCDPKKALRRGPEIVDAARRPYGAPILGASAPELSWAGMEAFKRRFTEPVPASREASLVERGMAVFHGTVRFLDRTTLAVGEDRLRARHVVIATGAEPRPLGIPGAELVATSTHFMELDRLPPEVLFIGGGYISFEFAHMAARAGVQVTILNRGPRALGQFDPALVDMLVDRSRDAGIAVEPEADAQEVERIAGGCRVRATVRGRERLFDAGLVVHGAGRVPATARLQLDRAGVAANKRGVEVDEFLQSRTNKAVYAAGDAAATPGPPLTPVAGMEGRAVADNLLHGNRTKPDYTAIPSAVFTIPALARVGLLEAEAREKGLDFDCKYSDMRGWYSVRRAGETHAAAKILIEKGSGRILGAHLLGPESSETINLFALAMRHDIRAPDLRALMTAYPSAASDLSSMV